MTALNGRYVWRLPRPTLAQPVSTPTQCPLQPAGLDRSHPNPRRSGRSQSPGRTRQDPVVKGLQELPSGGQPQGSDVEAERPQLLTAIVGDLVRAPRRHPDPVDAVAGHLALERLRDLV